MKKNIVANFQAQSVYNPMMGVPIACHSGDKEVIFRAIAANPEEALEVVHKRLDRNWRPSLYGQYDFHGYSGVRMLSLQEFLPLLNRTAHDWDQRDVLGIAEAQGYRLDNHREVGAIHQSDDLHLWEIAGVKGILASTEHNQSPRYLSSISMKEVANATLAYGLKTTRPISGRELLDRLVEYERKKTNPPEQEVYEPYKTHRIDGPGNVWAEVVAKPNLRSFLVSVFETEHIPRDAGDPHELEEVWRGYAHEGIWENHYQGEVNEEQLLRSPGEVQRELDDYRIKIPPSLFNHMETVEARGILQGHTSTHIYEQFDRISAPERACQNRGGR
jgi:hypothetical protein